MKTPRPAVLLFLLVSTVRCLFAAESSAPVVAEALVARETRRSSGIAPSSSLDSFAAGHVASRLAPMVAGTKVCKVAPTGSMRPLFDDNSLLLLEPAPFASLQIGDIVVFRHSATGNLIVHRILERRGDAFWTKGDHNKTMDNELVTAANYQGRVYGIIYAARTPGAPVAGGSLLADAR